MRGACHLTSRPVCRVPKHATRFRRHLPWGSVPYGVLIRAIVTTTAYLTVAIRSRGFSPPQRFDPARALWLYFTPHPPLGFGLQRVPHPVSRNASQRPCSPAVELRRLPTKTSTPERCSNRASVHPTVAVKRVIGAGALLTFAPSEVCQPGRWACALPSCTYSRYRPAAQALWVTTEGGASGCQSDRA